MTKFDSGWRSYANVRWFWHFGHLITGTVGRRFSWCTRNARRGVFSGTKGRHRRAAVPRNFFSFFLRPRARTRRKRHEASAAECTRFNYRGLITAVRRRSLWYVCIYCIIIIWTNTYVYRSRANRRGGGKRLCGSAGRSRSSRYNILTG